MIVSGRDCSKHTHVSTNIGPIDDHSESESDHDRYCCHECHPTLDHLEHDHFNFDDDQNK